MTRKAFVVGWPIAHSRSPRIHRFWLKRHGIDGDYLARGGSAGRDRRIPRDFAEKGYVGGNVTLPHKEAAFRACAVTTPIARRLEAANTLWLEGGRLYGDNTDVYGFTANLDERAPDWRRGSTALVIGAGGASRAVLQALIDAGFRSVVGAEPHARARRDAGEAFRRSGSAGGLDRLPNVLPDADLIVNATSAGLHDGDGLGRSMERRQAGRDRDRPHLCAARHAVPSRRERAAA